MTDDLLPYVLQSGCSEAYAANLVGYWYDHYHHMGGVLFDQLYNSHRITYPLDMANEVLAPYHANIQAMKLLIERVKDERDTVKARLGGG